MSEKTRFGRAAGWFDIPEEVRSAAPRITISGDSRVLVEGHRGLLEYADERIAAARVNGRILITGEGLRLLTMTDCELVVTGRIWTVEIE